MKGIHRYYEEIKEIHVELLQKQRENEHQVKSSCDKALLGLSQCNPTFKGGVFLSEVGDIVCVRGWMEAPPPSINTLVRSNPP